MSDVKRYTCTTGGMERHPRGEYVDHIEYERLERENAELRKKLDAAINEATRLRGILRHSGHPEMLVIRMSLGEYHYQKMIAPEVLTRAKYMRSIVGSCAEAMYEAMNEAIRMGKPFLAEQKDPE